ncbi:helix-turn-helix transcriptional regulator [Streptomyces sp. DH10]|uniref:helix-turn-helix transcriptional regulator n=1 Tax=Streptomyces sp. DH10 TaxID=3040121 RepID=UPI002442AB95|nr:helix-turn-helix transcriptional regulator [Streptomyces sp. DH10]MDG9711411.1 LuxR C-terminal-related transcriptional regulator [Streptomyces sp. DH10]
MCAGRPEGSPADAGILVGLFVGREWELARLRRASEDARGGTPSLIVIDGIPGVGKSTLVRKLLSELTDFTVLGARANRHEETLPFASLGHLTARIGSQSFTQGDTSTRPQTPLAAGTELLRLLDRLQNDRPVALVLDDADRADSASLLAIGFALRQLWHDRVLSVMVLQSWPPPWDESVRQTLEGVSHFIRIGLQGLSAHDVARLATAVRGPLPPGALERLMALTRGHPLLLDTLLSEPADPFNVEGRPVSIPVGVTTAVVQQVAGMAPMSRNVLDALAVLDDAVPVPQLGLVAGVSDVLAALDSPVRVGLVEWAAPGSDVAFVRFRHQLQRDAVYKVMSPSRRRHLHAEAAAVLGGSEALRHRVAAAHRFDAALARELRDTGAAELSQGHLGPAGTALAWAAQLTEGSDERQRLLCDAVRLFFWAGMDAQAVQHRSHVLVGGHSPFREEALGLMDFTRGRLSQARTRLTRAVEELGTWPRRPEVTIAVATERAAVCAIIGAGAEAETTAASALEEAGEAPDREPALPEPVIPPGVVASAQAFRAYGRSMQKGATEGLRQLDHLPAQAEDVTEEELPALFFRGLLRGVAGRFTEAEADLTVVTARSGSYGVRIIGLGSRVHLALCRFMTGAWPQARRDVEIGLAMVEFKGRNFDRASLHSLAATIASVQGNVDEAQEHISQAEEEAAVLDYLGAQFHVAVARATAARCRHDYDGVLHALSGVSHGTTTMGRSRLFAPWWVPLQVDALVACRRFDEARRILHVLTTAGLATDSEFYPVVHGWLSGRIREEQGHLRHAATLYQSGISGAHDRPTVPLYRALCEHAFGKCLSGLGDTDQALGHLRTAERLFAALDALPFLEACRADISALGELTAVGPLGWENLSSREREVAQLVGKGRTNREIADALFVSTKTVEYHLRNIFNKLDLRNRRELRDWVQREP